MYASKFCMTPVHFYSLSSLFSHSSHSHSVSQMSWASISPAHTIISYESFIFLLMFFLSHDTFVHVTSVQPSLLSWSDQTKVNIAPISLLYFVLFFYSRHASSEWYVLSRKKPVICIRIVRFCILCTISYFIPQPHTFICFSINWS